MSKPSASDLPLKEKGRGDASRRDSQGEPRGGEGKSTGKRRMAREMALQMLYQSELGSSTPMQVQAAFDRSEYLAGASGDYQTRKKLVDDAFLYATTLLRGATGHQEAIDRRIQSQADNWRLERMPAVDRNILRLAFYEILHEDETPPLVVVDEAIELAKKFGSEQSSRFINGLLDGFLKKHQPTAARG